jgi:hypothetical protein
MARSTRQKFMKDEVHASRTVSCHVVLCFKNDWESYQNNSLLLVQMRSNICQLRLRVQYFDCSEEETNFNMKNKYTHNCYVEQVCVCTGRKYKSSTNPIEP